MPNGSLLPAREVQVNAPTYGTWQYHPMTDWLPATGIDKVCMALRNAGTTTLKTACAYQVALVRTDNPSAWETPIGADNTGDNELCSTTTSISSNTAGAYWVRFGIAYQSTSVGTAFGQGTVWMQAATDAWGMDFGSKTFDVTAEQDSNNPQIEVLTPWIPAMFVDKVKMAIITSGMSLLGVQPMYQTADTFTKTASDWLSTNMGSAITTDHESCTGELPSTGTPFASVMWVRFGIASYKTSGTLGKGRVTVSTCIRTT